MPEYAGNGSEMVRKWFGNESAKGRYCIILFMCARVSMLAYVIVCYRMSVRCALYGYKRKHRTVVDQKERVIYHHEYLQ